MTQQHIHLMIHDVCWKGLDTIVCVASTTEPVSLVQICQKTEVKETLALQFMHQFQRKGWVRKKDQGVYEMKVNPMKVNALEVMKVCNPSGTQRHHKCKKTADFKGDFEKLDSTVYKLLQSKTVAELVST